MRLFVYEFASGGGFIGSPLVAGLAREGDLMLRALLDDLAAVPGIRLLSSRDPRLTALPGVETITPGPGEDALSVYTRGLAEADAAWPTAPEGDSILERLAKETEHRGRVLLGCRPEAIHVAASKRRTAGALRAAGMSVVPTYGPGDRFAPTGGRWVVKPDDGAGCEGMRLVEGWEEALALMEADPLHLVAQPWVDGTPMSLSLLCDRGRAVVLAANIQHVSLIDGRLAVDRICVNAVPDVGPRLADVATGVAMAIPGLWGYVGVDLIETASGPVVLEVNPRLTTSYCGLRRALGINTAAMVLDLHRTGRPPAWHPPGGTRAVEIPLESRHVA